MNRKIATAAFATLLLVNSASAVRADGQYGDKTDEPKKDEPKEEVVHSPVPQPKEIVDGGIGDLNFFSISAGLLTFGALAFLISKKSQTFYWFD